jgi:hypothetical protein
MLVSQKPQKPRTSFGDWQQEAVERMIISGLPTEEARENIIWKKLERTII